MSEKEIKVGDRVAVEDSRCSGIVTEIRDGRCKVRYPSGRVMNFPVEVLEHRDDPKTAFLTELSELLRKYDAKIDAGCMGYDSDNPYINIALGDNGDVEWTDSDFYNKDFRFPLTADNVFNYDK